jgi:hypothetical protein
MDQFNRLRNGDYVRIEWGIRPTPGFSKREHKMECWRIGILEYWVSNHHSTTPSFHYSSPMNRSSETKPMSLFQQPALMQDLLEEVVAFIVD